MSEYGDLPVREQLSELVDPVADRSSVDTVLPEFIVRDINLVNMLFEVPCSDFLKREIRWRRLPEPPRYAITGLF